MGNSIFVRIFFAVLLSFTVSSFVYFAFGNIYSSKILNYPDFQEQFHSGIYQYRILSGWLLTGIYEALGNMDMDYSMFKFKFLNPSSEPRMYLAFYLLNTFFTVLCGIMMALITECRNFVATASEKILMIAAGIFAIALTQFVIVPYDVSSYFLLLIFFRFLMQYLNSPFTSRLIILALIILVSTLNRESSALSLSLAATLLYNRYGLSKKTLAPVMVLGTVFLSTYLGMRLLNHSFTTNDGNLLAENFTQAKNMLGMLFWITFFLFSILISNSNVSRKNILIFHLLAVPYIIMSFYTGILYEARLYIPLFLSSLLLAKTDVRHSIKIS